MKSKKLVLLILSLFVIVTLTGCGGDSKPKRVDQLLVEASTLGGIGHSLLSGMTEVAGKVLPDVTLTLEATAGYGENAIRMVQGVGDLGIVGHDDAYAMYKKTGDYSNPKAEYLTVYAAHTLDWNIIVRKDSGINTIWDLKGKKVNKQPKGGASEKVSTTLLAALGIDHQDFYLNHTDAAEAMMSKTIDAHIVMGAPAQFRELATRIPLVVIDLPDEDIQKILTHLPYLAKMPFPAGQYYPGNSNINTVTLWALVLARKDLPEDVVYTLVKGVYENKSIMAAAHPSGDLLDPKQILEMNVPLHPGALKYYKELKIDIPQKLIP